jgi:hypothetical protein
MSALKISPELALNKLKATIQGITQRAAERAMLGRLTDEERRILLGYMKQLELAAEGIIDVVRGSSSKRAQVIGFGSLRLALNTSFAIGWAIESPMTVRLGNESAANARVAKALVSRKIDAWVSEFAQPVREKHPNWRANRIASEISGPLNARLREYGLRGEDMKANSISKRVKKFLTTD